MATTNGIGQLTWSDNTVTDVKNLNHDVELTSDSTADPKQTPNHLDRYINLIPLIAFALTLQTTWEGVTVTFQAGLINGGPTALVYGSMTAWVGSLALGASLAEMASMNPTVGAQYRWTSKFAPPGLMTPAFWGLIQGWITVGTWVGNVAQAAFLLGTSVQGLLILNDDTYIPQRWQGVLLVWAILTVPLFVNVFARKLLPTIEMFGGIAHVVTFITWIVVLVTLAPRSSAEFVFESSVFGVSGWSNHGIQWCIGLLAGVWPMGGLEGVLHMSDEVKDAPRNVPYAMMYSILISGAMQLCIMITILFCLGPVETALNTPTGYPIIQVIYGATKSKASATVMMSFVLFNGTVAMFSALASTSRLTWVFARDHGLPYSKFFGAVHPKLRIPLNSLMVISILIMLLQLIDIGSTTALFAILSGPTMGSYISYVLPIYFILLTKLRGDHITYGPFRLGKAGIFINAFAVVYALFVLMWLPLPPYRPVTWANMNYGGPVIGLIILLALLDWFISGKKRFKVPAEDVRTQ